MFTTCLLLEVGLTSNNYHSVIILYYHAYSVILCCNTPYYDYLYITYIASYTYIANVCPILGCYMPCNEHKLIDECLYKRHVTFQYIYNINIYIYVCVCIYCLCTGICMYKVGGNGLATPILAGPVFFSGSPKQSLLAKTIIWYLNGTIFKL